MMKNPVLMVGILMISIMLFQLNNKGMLDSRKAKLTPSSCKAVLIKLDRRIPANWKTFCEGKTINNLVVEIQSTGPKIADIQKLKAFLYRDLANKMGHIAKSSPSDNLERTDFVRVRLIHQQGEINALTRGHFIIKLATLTNPELLAEHFKTTVQVQEKIFD